MLNFLKNKITGIDQQISNFQMMASSKNIVFTDFLSEYQNLNEAITVGPGKVSITPRFGASSKLFIIKPYSIVSSTDPHDGWGGWRHCFGHHTFVCCAVEGEFDSMPIFTDPGRAPIVFVPVAYKLGCFLTLKNFDNHNYDKFLNLITNKYPSKPLNKDLIVVQIKNLYTVIAKSERGAQWLEKNIQYNNRRDLTEKDVLAIKLMYI